MTNDTPIFPSTSTPCNHKWLYATTTPSFDHSSLAFESLLLDPFFSTKPPSKCATVRTSLSTRHHLLEYTYVLQELMYCIKRSTTNFSFSPSQWSRVTHH